MTRPPTRRHACIFGPVPSRRLGRSLGIDLVPHKVCSLDCRYCECGPTTTLTLERREWVPTTAVLAELEAWLAAEGDGGRETADYLTFSGSGEPTLHRDLGLVAEWLAERTGVPLALLTNGTLLGDPALRAELSSLSVICPSLDTAREETFRAFNRPHASLTVKALVEGLIALRQDVSAEIWLEVLLADGVNDSDEELDALAEAIGRINPHRVQLNTAVRPGTDRRLGPASADTLARALARFGPRAEAVAGFRQEPSTAAVRPDRDVPLEAQVLAVLRRRPETVEALCVSLGVPSEILAAEVRRLVDAGRLQAEARGGLSYYRASPPEG